ncbi:hypothetical protein J132_05957 [Termitomyces sp. J132]|nr:hypothetical protein J132_05957 [Termitomyces sp. J132]
MSHIPLVNSAIRVYEQGKASSRVVKYGAEMMESSVKSISRPVIDRLPVNQLDEFACRQLDRFDRYRRPSNSEAISVISPQTSSKSSQSIPGRSNESESIPIESKDPGLPKVKLKSGSSETSTIGDHPSSRIGNEFEKSRLAKGKAKSWLHASSPFVGPAPTPPDLTSSSSSQSPAEERQVTRRSRWQAVLSEAGGLSAALSDESLRRLKYCLQWLQYATAHIDAQILILRDFTASLQPLPSQTPAPHPPISQAHMRTLIAVRRDIVHTVKQVVDVVSRYAGGALPEPARGRVRGFVLGLPQRHTRHQDENGDPVSASTAIVAAQRILTLATESLDMMRGVTGVVKDSLDRADAWVGRFRTVGLQRGERTEDNATGSSFTHGGDPAMELDFSSLQHRRVLSFSSQADESDVLPSPYSGTSSYSSYAGGSSIPSTPGAGTQTPVYVYSRETASPNLMGLGLSSMTLIDSAFGTPKSVVSGLPDDMDPDDSGAIRSVSSVVKEKEQNLDEIKIVGTDVEVEAEDRADFKADAMSGKMDVDV